MSVSPNAQDAPTNASMSCSRRHDKHMHENAKRTHANANAEFYVPIEICIPWFVGQMYFRVVEITPGCPSNAMFHGGFGWSLNPCNR